MKKWCVYYQVQRYELVDYVSADLEITDELYEKIQENIENGIPVHSGEVGEELEKLAQKHYENYVTQFACDDYDMPWRGDYDSDEAYERHLKRIASTFLRMILMPPKKNTKNIFRIERHANGI